MALFNLRKKNIIRILLVVTVILTAGFFILCGLALLGPLIGPLSLTPTPRCLYNGKAVVWFDRNANGVRDQEDPPISGIKIFYDGLDTDLTEAIENITDSDGEALVAIWSDMCLSLSFGVNVEVPNGYYSTTPTRYQVMHAREDDPTNFWRGETYDFGLARLTP
ncbi:MAG: hypothetical protein AB1894_12580 [Chloroflexota bacterium]